MKYEDWLQEARDAERESYDRRVLQQLVDALAYEVELITSALPDDPQTEPSSPAAGCPQPSGDRAEDPTLDDHADYGRRR